MTGFNHTLAGCLIAVAMPTPFAPIIAFGSHFALDALPHFGNDPRFTRRSRSFRRLLAIDGLLCTLSLGFAIWLFPDNWFLIGLCAFLSALPDFMWLLWRGKIRRLDWFFRFSGWVQWGERPYLYPLEITYAALMVTALIMLS